MTSNEIRSALQAAPFRPFRLHFGSGRTVEVPHPEFASVSPSGRTAVVFTDPSHEGDKFQIVDILLVEALEFVGPRDNGSNGTTRSHA